MAENLRTTRYTNGTPIPIVEFKAEWKDLEINDKACCSRYEAIISNPPRHGVLYTWPAAMNGQNANNDNPSNIRGACPDGWHLPGRVEWEELAKYISNKVPPYYPIPDGYDWRNVGIYLKSKWGWSQYKTATDQYGFSGSPCSYRTSWGTYSDELADYVSYKEKTVYWWSTTIVYGQPLSYGLVTNDHRLKGGNEDKRYGFSVRCVKD